MILIKCLVKSISHQKTKRKKKQTKKTNRQTELATANEKLYENCRIVRKKDGATDWQNKDEEVQSDSNRALCDIRTSS